MKEALNLRQEDLLNFIYMRQVSRGEKEKWKELFCDGMNMQQLLDIYK